MHKEQRKMIAASLWAQPATLDELSEREFLKRTSTYGIDRMLFIMENDGWIYFKGETYYTYKSFALSKEMAEYELEAKRKPTKRKTAIEAIKEWNKEN